MIGLLVVIAAWGVPVGLLTRERMGPRLPSWALLLALVSTLGAALPAYVIMTMAYEGAEAIEGWVGGERGPPRITDAGAADGGYQ